MNTAAVYAIASLITDEELTEDYIIPSPFDEHVAPAVAAAVAKAAMDTGVAQQYVNPQEIEEKTRKLALIKAAETVMI
jgi:malate dehydrogenase (oxaloacetate-decarboxylating)